MIFDHEEEYKAGRLSTTSGKEPRNFDSPAPDPEVDPLTGQHKSYWVLSPSEREKGFVRPVRTAYRHVGRPGPVHPLRDLTDDEKKQYETDKYVKFEEYPKDESPVTGRFWTQEQLNKINKGCGTSTSMGRALAETYAREPGFYGATFCCTCQGHFPVGSDGEFVWEDGERVGT